MADIKAEEIKMEDKNAKENREDEEKRKNDKDEKTKNDIWEKTLADSADKIEGKITEKGRKNILQHHREKYGKLIK